MIKLMKDIKKDVHYGMYLGWEH